MNAHREMALDEVPLKRWTRSILMPLKTAPLLFPPTFEPLGQITCFIADPGGNVIEIGS